MPNITSVSAREILASGGTPSVEARVELEDGAEVVIEHQGAETT